MHGSSNYAFAVRFLLKWRFKQVPDSVSAKVTFAKGQVGFVVVSLLCFASFSLCFANVGVRSC